MPDTCTPRQGRRSGGRRACDVSAYRALTVPLPNGPREIRDLVAYTPPLMSNRSAARQSRAEARRRARLAAQGQVADVEIDDEAAPTPPSNATVGGFLARLIPPAPPLSGKGDPLAGFTYNGPARSMVAALWLLVRHPLYWLVPALIWMGAWPFQAGFGGATASLVGSVVQYVALIGAGWVGWQRPWLFAIAGVLVGWGAVAWYFVLYGTRSGVIAPDQVLVALATQTALQLLVAFVAGWYGGYLRRRLADQRPRPAETRRKRR
jgi:hypothetical protein